MKRKVRLTESDLHRIIKESVKKVIKENNHLQMGKYHIWTDSESYVNLPKKLYFKIFNDIEEAYNAASDFVHQFDGEPYKVIVHVEDLNNDETVDTVENITNTIKENKEQDNMKSFDELIGLDIEEAANKLGYWWRCDSSSVNTNVGFYVFKREPFGKIELRTNKDNIVTHEHHSPLSERYLQQ